MASRKYIKTTSLLWKVLWLFKLRKNRDLPVSEEENDRRNKDEPIEIE